MYKIGSTLKSLRTSNGYSIVEVIKKFAEINIPIKAKTDWAWMRPPLPFSRLGLMPPAFLIITGYYIKNDAVAQDQNVLSAAGFQRRFLCCLYS